jgi:hypothetical protein
VTTVLACRTPSNTSTPALIQVSPSMRSPTPAWSYCAAYSPLNVAVMVKSPVRLVP